MDVKGDPRKQHRNIFIVFSSCEDREYMSTSVVIELLDLLDITSTLSLDWFNALHTHLLPARGLQGIVPSNFLPP